MDVIVRSINNPVNVITALMSGLFIDLDKAIKIYNSTSTLLLVLVVVKVCFISNCSGLAKWIFILAARQTSDGRLFM